MKHFPFDDNKTCLAYWWMSPENCCPCLFHSVGACSWPGEELPPLTSHFCTFLAARIRIRRLPPSSKPASSELELLDFNDVTDGRPPKNVLSLAHCLPLPGFPWLLLTFHNSPPLPVYLCVCLPLWIRDSERSSVMGRHPPPAVVKIYK